MSLADQSPDIEQQVPKTDAERALEMLQRRDAPKFFIAHLDGSLKFCSPNLVGSVLLSASKRALARLHRQGRAISEVAWEQLDAEFMLRIVPLAGELADFFAIFIEAAGGRSAPAAMVRRFGFTRRELHVFQCIKKGYSTPRIAKVLFISEGTVGDHVKSLFRKTHSNSRSELLMRVLDGHADLAGQAGEGTS